MELLTVCDSLLYFVETSRFLSGHKIMFQQSQLRDMMHMAVVNNRPNFVRLLLEHGVNVQKFLTVKRLLKLYKNVRVKLYLLHSVAHFVLFIGLISLRK